MSYISSRDRDIVHNGGATGGTDIQKTKSNIYEIASQDVKVENQFDQ